jgi:hypothetical protein
MMNVEFIILTIHHFLFFSKYDSEVFDLFDPIDRIDPKRNNAVEIELKKKNFKNN